MCLTKNSSILLCFTTHELIVHNIYLEGTSVMCLPMIYYNTVLHSVNNKNQVNTNPKSSNESKSIKNSFWEKIKRNAGYENCYY